MRNGSTEHSNQLKGYLRGENQNTKLNIPIHSDEAKWQMMCPGLRCTKINKLLALHPGPPPAHQSTVCGAHRDLAMGAPGCGAQIDGYSIFRQERNRPRRGRDNGGVAIYLREDLGPNLVIVSYLEWMGLIWILRLNLTLKFRLIILQNKRDLNQGALHLWSKFGDPSLNGSRAMAWTSKSLTYIQTDRHRRTQTQATTIPEGENWTRVKTAIKWMIFEVRQCVLMPS